MEITSGQPAISVGGMNGFGGDAGIMFLAFLAMMGGFGGFGMGRGPMGPMTGDQTLKFSEMISAQSAFIAAENQKTRDMFVQDKIAAMQSEINNLKADARMQAFFRPAPLPFPAM